MSFWDNVKKLTQPMGDDEYDDYDDEDELDYDDETAEPAPRSRRGGYTPAAEETAGASEEGGNFSGRVVNMNTNGKQDVILFHAKTFGDATAAAEELRAKKAVILNMENVDKALTRRVVDFLSGCIYALDGKVKKIAQSTYLFCPHSMNIVGDLENTQGDADSYI